MENNVSADKSFKFTVKVVNLYKFLTKTKKNLFFQSKF